jgi:hypothetical protein
MPFNAPEYYKQPKNSYGVPKASPSWMTLGKAADPFGRTRPAYNGPLRSPTQAVESLNRSLHSLYPGSPRANLAESINKQAATPQDFNSPTGERLYNQRNQGRPRPTSGNVSAAQTGKGTFTVRGTPEPNNPVANAYGYWGQANHEAEHAYSQSPTAANREIAPSIGDVVFATEKFQREQGKPLQHNLQLPGLNHDVTWMNDMAANYGYWDGRSMQELLETPAGQQWLQKASGFPAPGEYTPPATSNPAMTALMGKDVIKRGPMTSGQPVPGPILQAQVDDEERRKYGGLPNGYAPYRTPAMTPSATPNTRTPTPGAYPGTPIDANVGASLQPAPMPARDRSMPTPPVSDPIPPRIDYTIPQPNTEGMGAGERMQAELDFTTKRMSGEIPYPKITPGGRPPKADVAQPPALNTPPVAPERPAPPPAPPKRMAEGDRLQAEVNRNQARLYGAIPGPGANDTGIMPYRRTLLNAAAPSYLTNPGAQEPTVSQPDDGVPPAPTQSTMDNLLDYPMGPEAAAKIDSDFLAGRTPQAQPANPIPGYYSYFPNGEAMANGVASSDWTKKLTPDQNAPSSSEMVSEAPSGDQSSSSMPIRRDSYGRPYKDNTDYVSLYRTEPERLTDQNNWAGMAGLRILDPRYHSNKNPTGDLLRDIDSKTRGDTSNPMAPVQWGSKPKGAAYDYFMQMVKGQGKPGESPWETATRELEAQSPAASPAAGEPEPPTGALTARTPTPKQEGNPTETSNRTRDPIEDVTHMYNMVGGQTIPQSSIEPFLMGNQQVADEARKIQEMRDGTNRLKAATERLKAGDAAGHANSPEEQQRLEEAARQRYLRDNGPSMGQQTARLGQQADRLAAQNDATEQKIQEFKEGKFSNVPYGARNAVSPYGDQDVRNWKSMKKGPTEEKLLAEGKADMDKMREMTAANNEAMKNRATNAISNPEQMRKDLIPVAQAFSAYKKGGGDLPYKQWVQAYNYRNPIPEDAKRQIANNYGIDFSSPDGETYVDRMESITPNYGRRAETDRDRQRKESHARRVEQARKFDDAQKEVVNAIRGGANPAAAWRFYNNREEAKRQREEAYKYYADDKALERKNNIDVENAKNGQKAMSPQEELASAMQVQQLMASFDPATVYDQRFREIKQQNPQMLPGDIHKLALEEANKAGEQRTSLIATNPLAKKYASAAKPIPNYSSGVIPGVPLKGTTDPNVLENMTPKPGTAVDIGRLFKSFQVQGMNLNKEQFAQAAQEHGISIPPEPAPGSDEMNAWWHDPGIFSKEHALNLEERKQLFKFLYGKDLTPPEYTAEDISGTGDGLY